MSLGHGAQVGGKTCELRTKVRLGGPIGECIGGLGGTFKEYTTILVQGSCKLTKKNSNNCNNSLNGNRIWAKGISV